MANIIPRLKNKWTILIGIVLLLSIMNPSKTDFLNYLKANGLQEQCAENGGRTGYFLIFSIYRLKGPCDYGYTDDTYIGLFKNFIKISH